MRKIVFIICSFIALCMISCNKPKNEQQNENHQDTIYLMDTIYEEHIDTVYQSNNISQYNSDYDEYPYE